MDDTQQQQPTAVDRARLDAAMLGVVGKMEREATRRVSLRKPKEQQWLLDEAQYHGKYDEETDRGLAAGKRSRLFMNETGRKCDVLTAKLYDLLFPTDDKNYSLDPTPVPTLTKAADEAEQVASQHAAELKKAKEQQKAAAEAPPGQEPIPSEQPPSPGEMEAMQAKADVAKEAADRLRSIKNEAQNRCDLMASEIEDQLQESNYAAIKRDQIEAAVRYGTGVTKGPVTGYRLRKGWQRDPKMQPVTDEQGAPKTGPDGKPVMQHEHDDAGAPQYEGDYKMRMTEGETPAMVKVSHWNFFPDPDSPNVMDGNGNYERDLFNRKQVSGMQHLVGYRKDQIRELLREGPRGGAPEYLTTLRTITEQQQTGNALFHVWHYSGPLEAEDVLTLALAAKAAATTPDEAAKAEATVREISDVDPLTEVNAVVCFCQGKVLKFAIYPLDSGECMYSVYNLVKDETSPFGYGLPTMIRDPQRALNSAWRAMMDNAGLIVSPNIIVAKDKVTPENGFTEFGKGAKVWLAEDGLPDKNAAFGLFEFTSRQTELANIIALAKQFIDDMTAMPQITQGNPESLPKDTPFGTTVLMTNASNIVFRRYVRNFDDDVTVPDLRRMYDWNMQFNPKEEIKGDYNVDARGSSYLLARELQSQTLLAIAINLGPSPVYGPMLKNRELLRKIFKAQMISPDEVVLTDTEIDDVLEQTAMNDPAAQAAQMKAVSEQKAAEAQQKELDAKVAIAESQHDTQKQVAELQVQVEVYKTAQTMKMTVDQLRTELAKNRETIQHKERVMAVEVAAEQRNAEQAAAAGEDPTGSGGYISAGRKPKPRKKANGGVPA